MCTCAHTMLYNHTDKSTKKGYTECFRFLSHPREKELCCSSTFLCGRPQKTDIPQMLENMYYWSSLSNSPLTFPAPHDKILSIKKKEEKLKDKLPQMNIHVSELADLMRYVQPYGSKLKTPCAPDDPGLMPLSIRTDLFLIYPKMTTFFFFFHFSGFES